MVAEVSKILLRCTECGDEKIAALALGEPYAVGSCLSCGSKRWTLEGPAHPYRAASTRVDVPGKRWGATRWVKWYVRHLAWLDPVIPAMRAERKRWRDYRARIRIYEAEIREWRAKAEASGRFAATVPRPKRPTPPPRPTYE